MLEWKLYDKASDAFLDYSYGWTAKQACAEREDVYAVFNKSLRNQQ